MKTPKHEDPGHRPIPFAPSAVLVFAVALAVRLGHLWFLRRSPFMGVLLGDAQGYDAWARRIADGDWLGQGVFYQAPLYPYFLGAIYSFSRDPFVVRVCQAIVGAGSCALLGYAAAGFLDKRAGLVAGLLLAFYGPAIFFDTVVQKSVLDLFLLCVLLALLSRIGHKPARPLHWLAVGITLGALGLTRENALVLAPAVLTWTWLRSKRDGGSRFRDAALVVVGLSLALVPIGVRNRIVGGEFVLTTAQSGPNFFIGNNPNADGTYVPLRAGRGSFEYEQVDASDLAAQQSGRVLSPREVSNYWFARAIQYIRTQPRNWLTLERRKFVLLWNVSEVIDTESQEAYADYSPPLWLTIHVVNFGVLAPLALVGVWITWRDGPRLWLLYSMVACYAVSVLAFYVVARYRLLLVPFLVVFAAAALVRARGYLRTHGHGEIGFCTAAFAIAAALCNRPAEPANLMRTITYQNLGTALLEAGRVEDAMTAFEQGLKATPEYAPSYAGLGSALRQQGRLDEAIGRFEEALRLRPDFQNARFNLANALAARGRLAEAIASYEDVLRHQSDGVDPHANVDVRSNLGTALVAVGRLDEAIEQFRKAAALAPSAATPHYNLGHTLLTRGNLDEAIASLSRAIEIDATSVPARDELGGALLAKGRFEEAAQQFREAIRLSPRSAQAHNNLGIALGSMGRSKEAADAFRAALAIDPANAEARANLTLILDAQRRTPR